MSLLTIGFEAPRILDFDIEARPLGWYGGDYTHKETTAIASAWIVNGEATDIEVLMLDRTRRSRERMFKGFLRRYAEADMVTGHYIRSFDLPLINADLLEMGMDPLGQKLAEDTKHDLPKLHGTSKSQENLGSTLGIEAPKVAMSQADWREVNRLTPRGREIVRARVVGDIVQHVQMREELRRRGWLSPPKVWTPGGGGIDKYTP